ncbi:uncharacterized protein G2W53_032675 [Senna tora]|uniref:Uncharacterized protein n=1 Tax=Senna tora TaxID=362788 RepID=A0A834WC19_9FABA|nr:uncharacterized protein G2W53_032675 [Senna tora]
MERIKRLIPITRIELKKKMELKKKYKSLIPKAKRVF